MNIIRRVACILLLSIALVHGNAQEIARSGLYFGAIARKADNRCVYSLKDILANARLHFYGIDCNMKSYTLSIKPDDGKEPDPYYIQGEKLSGTVKCMIINGAGKSGSIFLENIKAIAPDGRLRFLDGMVIRYVNY